MLAIKRSTGETKHSLSVLGVSPLRTLKHSVLISDHC